MISKIINTSVISFAIVVLLHYIYLFLKQNLTTPIVHDLVTVPTEKYREIQHILQEPTDHKKMESTEMKEDKHEMKDELKHYLRTLTSKS